MSGFPLLISTIVGATVLQSGQKLVGVQRDHAVVMVARGQQHGRVLPGALLRHAHIVQGRVRQQEREVVRLVGITIVRPPSVADGELVKPQHVHHSDLCNHSCKQVWPLHTEDQPVS